MSPLTPEQRTVASEAGDQAEAAYLRDHPHHYQEAAKAGVDAHAAALAALHGRGRWGSWQR